jgi:GNAT superfamily N-acetyltransferase
MELTVQKALTEDFRDFLPLLNILNPRIADHKWAEIINAKWADEDYVGFKATQNDKIIGIIITLFSKRLYDGYLIRYCNISSIVVLPEFRNLGVANALWDKVIELKSDYIITGFNPISYTIGSYVKRGFEYYDDLATFLYYNRSVKTDYSSSKRTDNSTDNSEYLRYSMDNLQLKPLTINYNNKNLFLLFESKFYTSKIQKFLNKIFRKIRINKRLHNEFFLPHYLSNSLTDESDLNIISDAVFREYKVKRLAIPKYFYSQIHKKTISLGFTFLLYRPTFLQLCPIDTLYTEYFLIK